MSRMLLDDHFEFRGGATHGGERFGVRPRVQSAKVVPAARWMVLQFIPNGWAASAGGFPAMTGPVTFLMKDVVLLAVAIYLLKQDVMRVSRAAEAEMAPLLTGQPASGALTRTL